MNPNDLAVIRDMIDAVSAILEGRIPPEVKRDDPDQEEVRELASLIRRLIESHGTAGTYIEALAKGRLDAAAPRANSLVSPFKQLHANLRHLVWQARQVAQGDLSQKVDFMGDFSTTFNRMIASLREKEKLEAALKKSEAKYRTLYASMKEGVALHEVIYDNDGNARDYRILDINPAFETITMVKRHGAIGTLASTLYNMSPPPYLETYADVARTGNATAFEIYFAPMGKHFSISVFSPGKGMFGTVFSDITERKTDEFNRLRQEKLQGALETAGGVCHEMNQPLMAASGYAELLLMDVKETDRNYDKLVKVGNSIDRMASITKKLMNITHYENRTYAGGSKIIDLEKSSPE